MPHRLKNLDVQWISLVKMPANGLPLLLKDANTKPFRAVKTDDARRMVYGIVYAPDVVDSQGDFADRFEIERAAHAFLKGNRTARVDANHEFEALPGAYVAESWIVRAADPEFADWVPSAWAVGIKIEDEALWEAVKSGAYGGLSLAGNAEREAVIDASAAESAGESVAKASESPVSDEDLKALARAIMNNTDGIVAMRETLVAGLADLAKAIRPPASEPVSESPDVRLDEILRMQTALADRLTAVEKQRLSAEHAPPPPPKSWLREVL